MNRAKERYSFELMTLIARMLKKDVKERLGFAELIDELNPLLQANLHAIKQIHSNHQSRNNSRNQTPL